MNPVDWYQQWEKKGLKFLLWLLSSSWGLEPYNEFLRSKSLIVQEFDILSSIEEMRGNNFSIETVDIFSQLHLIRKSNPIVMVGKWQKSQISGIINSSIFFYFSIHNPKTFESFYDLSTSDFCYLNFSSQWKHLSFVHQ